MKNFIKLFCLSAKFLLINRNNGESRIGLQTIFLQERKQNTTFKAKESAYASFLSPIDDPVYCFDFLY
ncbi:MAG: hypothetical protein IPG78_19335 [Ignavibacteria bacterium]|nr:hypothetical protein [Ignavibacteria bacterium]